MARVYCDVDYTEDEDGKPMVMVTCQECGHFTESYGHGPASVRRCLALLREECPEGKKNFYVAAEDQDDDYADGVDIYD